MSTNDGAQVVPVGIYIPPKGGDISPGPERAFGISSLPGHWKGVRFRSRTEARWSVFFDAIGAAWQYEPEAFRLPDGSFYLPDFWLPDFRLWVEVKGHQGPEYHDWVRMHQLVEGSGYALLILDGPPRHQWYRRIIVEEHWTPDLGDDSHMRRHREAMVLTDWVAWHERYSCAPEYRLYSGDLGCDLPCDDPPMPGRGIITSAFHAARAADVSRPPGSEGGSAA